MWVMTKAGFFSAVQHREHPTRLLIRARNQRDIRNLCDLLNTFSDAEPVEPYAMQSSDYAWRVEIPASDWARALAVMALDIDYDNFKSAIHRISPMHASAYHAVWSVLLRIEDRKPGKRGKGARSSRRFKLLDKPLPYFPNGVDVESEKPKPKRNPRKAGERTQPKGRKRG